MSSSETTSDSHNSHSLNERKVVPKEDNYRRDSFDDRFCDDLCEDILQYLSLEDKLRLQCVSKQFQRTVFQSVYELYLDESDGSVTHLLDTLGKKSKKLNCFEKLRSLSIGFIDSDLRQLLPKLKAFPALKRLKLWTDIHEWEDLFIENDYPIDSNHLFSFEAFEGLSNITHLSLCLDLRQISNESILKEIDINLPKLQYLEIKNKFNTTPEGVTQMADILSRLSRLETLKLMFESGVDFKPIEVQITEKCRKIKEIEIKSDSKYYPNIDFFGIFEDLFDYAINFVHNYGHNYGFNFKKNYEPDSQYD